MKTLHLSIMLAGIAMFGMFSFLPSFADNVNSEWPTGPGQFQLSQIVASGNNAYVIYQTYNGSEAFFRKSIDGGATFDKIIKINDDDNGEVISPQITTSGNNVYISWDVMYLNHTVHTMFKKSTDNGNTFGNAIVLNPYGAKTGYAVINQMTSLGSNVYAAMSYDDLTSSGGSQILKTSADNGDTFGKPVSIFNDGDYFSTKIAVSEKNVYVVSEKSYACQQGGCNQVNIFFRKSTDNGTTFGKMINLSNGTLVLAEQMIASKNNVFVVWQDGPYPAIFFTKSSDGGSTFSNKINLSKNITNNSEPQIAVEGNNIYVVFHDRGSSPSHMGVYFTKSSDGGSTFSNPVKIADRGTSSLHIATSEKNVYMIWDDFNSTSNRSNVFFTKSSDNGTNFDNPVNLSSEIKGETFGQLAVEEKNVYVGLGTGFPADYVYFRASNDGGRTFGNVTDLNHDSSQTKIPEFPFAVPMLLASFVPVIVFYRTRFRK
ncbi:exported protein of unknown function [Nitrosotalea devaniterrae]|uniref:Sialidase domain-containing protein n=1 Tax=Nitrosotalea devaniterrae TaxID=1078905 RepID=A0A128A227_9ARCH|nr:exported protein of unknown function [Candidatus Nitrosotalea devanaterra]